MNNEKICVCGAGTMGGGIAQVSAQAGFATVLYELNEEILYRAKNSIDKNLSNLVAKGKMEAEDKDKTLSRIQFTKDIGACRADIFVEAIVEKPAAKIELFNQLAEINSDQSIFATNTSSLSVESIAENIKDPGRVIGMHFFNPAPLMKLVEVVVTSCTRNEVTKRIVDLAKAMNKMPVICRDAPGFIVNRIARPYYIESLRLVEEGLIDISQLDAIMEASGFKMGPFRLMDLIGNDINYAVSTSVYEQLDRPVRLKPSYIQEEKVRRGDLGKKTGKGYYEY